MRRYVARNWSTPVMHWAINSKHILSWSYMERTCIRNLNWTSSCYVTVVSFSSFEDLLAQECTPTKQWSLGCTCSAEMCQGTMATDIIAMLQHVIPMQGRSHFQQPHGVKWWCRTSRRTKWLRISKDHDDGTNNEGQRHGLTGTRGAPNRWCVKLCSKDKSNKQVHSSSHDASQPFLRKG